MRNLKQHKPGKCPEKIFGAGRRKASLEEGVQEGRMRNLNKED